MSIDEPTQNLSREQLADAPTTALPGPLNLAGRSDTTDSSTTDVLSLDELFDAQPAPAEARPPATSTVADAPTWTAMPVVPVRSEPITPVAAAPAAPAKPAGPPLGGRVREDAAAAWEGAVRRSRAWLERDDNGLTLVTAVVAMILILAIAGLH